jgi:hypothetical protein
VGAARPRPRRRARPAPLAAAARPAAYGLSGLLAPLQPRRARRKRLAALFAHLHGLPPGGTALLLEDDRLFAAHAQRFLADRHAPYPIPLYDEHGRYLFRSPRKVEVLAQAMLRAAGRGRDNELYVLLVDLLDLDDAEVDPLVRAVRVALARHHQVIVICPWAPGVPPPDESRAAEAAPPEDAAAFPPADVDDWVTFLEEQTVRRYHRAYRRVRQTFGRMGVLVVRANQGDPVRLVLDRIDYLRRTGVHYR